MPDILDRVHAALVQQFQLDGTAVEAVLSPIRLEYCGDSAYVGLVSEYRRGWLRQQIERDRAAGLGVATIAQRHGVSESRVRRCLESSVTPKTSFSPCK